jgi:hypothetical protein
VLGCSERRWRRPPNSKAKNPPLGPVVDAAEAREQLLRVAARDREADALVGDAPDARRRRARVTAGY